MALQSPEVHLAVHDDELDELEREHDELKTKHSEDTREIRKDVNQMKWLMLGMAVTTAAALGESLVNFVSAR